MFDTLRQLGILAALAGAMTLAAAPQTVGKDKSEGSKAEEKAERTTEKAEKQDTKAEDEAERKDSDNGNGPGSDDGKGPGGNDNGPGGNNGNGPGGNNGSGPGGGNDNGPGGGHGPGGNDGHGPSHDNQPPGGTGNAGGPPGAADSVLDGPNPASLPDTIVPATGAGKKDEDEALDAVNQRRALPLDDILSTARQSTKGDVIDARLVTIGKYLLYELKVLEANGDVKTLYYYAKSGKPVVVR